MEQENIKDVLIAMVGSMREQSSVIKELKDEIKVLKSTKGVKEADSVTPATKEELDSVMNEFRF